jgi:methylated-DNA-[protein]-cysteine S-methyltransferase
MTPFQQAVLMTVDEIPFGETRSYGEIAAELNKPGAARAVGRANATNPIPLVIPCHRVIGADGSLRGYGAGEGLRTKKWLLEFENKQKETKPALQ